MVYRVCHHEKVLADLYPEITAAGTETFLIDKSPATVFNAIRQISKWWNAGVKGKSTAPVDEFEVKFADIHDFKHKVVEYVPFKRIVWLVTDSKLTFIKNHQEWNGSKNVFEISTENRKTRLTLCMSDYSLSWSVAKIVVMVGSNI